MQDDGSLVADGGRLYLSTSGHYFQGRAKSHSGAEGYPSTHQQTR